MPAKPPPTPPKKPSTRDRIVEALSSLGLSHAAVALVVALGTMTITILFVDNGANHGPQQPRRTVTITLGKPDHSKTTVTIPAQAAKEASASDVANHEGLKNETPPGVPSDQIEAAREQQDKLAQTDQLPIVSPDAAPSQRGCTSRFVRNYSSRRGVRPRLLVTHYTVSPNRPGWDDVWAIVNLFNTPSFAASSNYVIDSEGHCAYIVRESDKAWTQATANPVSISIEVVNTGREKTLAGPAGLRKIGLVWADAARRWKIPLQQGKVAGCMVVRPGIVDHHALGACGGGHFDVTPYSVPAVIAAAKAVRDGGISSADRATCRKLNWWRTHGRPKGKAEQNAVARRKALEKRGVICTSKGATRR